MAFRPQQDIEGSRFSRAPRFLWTDLGALFGLLAVTGFAVYRTWF